MTEKDLLIEMILTYQDGQTWTRSNLDPLTVKQLDNILWNLN